MFRRCAAALLVALALLVSSATASATDDPGVERRPILFVHGFAGSGNQFEAQALRFASNGWDDDHIAVFEYDSQFGEASMDEVHDRLDRELDELLDSAGAEQADVLGHSLGTGVMQGYLGSDPERAARVANYVNLDGAPADAPPGGVPTLAVWGIGNDDQEITGAQNEYVGDQSHTEVVTSPETFELLHRFFTGEEPGSTEVVRSQEGRVDLWGRALYFISNVGADGQVDIHEVDAATGQRVADEPEATFPLTGDGEWGPFSADPTAHYEFVLSGTSLSDREHHWYRQPFERSNRHVRLLTSEPGGIVDSLWENSDEHVNLVIIRNKEWWGDQDLSDQLTVQGTPVISATTTPQDQRIIGLFVTDDGLDGEGTADEPIAAFAALPFLTGVDLPVAAGDPPDDTVAITATPRLGDAPVTINVPNWASSGHAVSVQFDDHVRTVAPAAEPDEPDEPDEPSEAEVVPDDEGTDPVPFVVAGVVIVVLVVMLFVVRRRRPAP